MARRIGALVSVLAQPSACQSGSAINSRGSKPLPAMAQSVRDASRPGVG